MTDATVIDKAATPAEPVIPSTPAQTAEPVTPESLAVRDTPAFKAVTKQIEIERAEKAELKARLDAIEAKEAAAQADAEKAALLAKGDYEALLAKKDAEVAAIKATAVAEKAAHDAAILSGQIKIALLAAGAVNETFLSGAVIGYSGDADGIAAYVDGLKADPANAPLFGQAQARHGLPAPGSGAPAASGSTNWTTIKESLRDPKKASEAAASINAFVLANGKMPPGF